MVPSKGDVNHKQKILINKYGTLITDENQIIH